MRRLLVLPLLLAACADDGAPDGATPPPRDRPAPPVADAPDVVVQPPERRHADTRARLDLSGAPEGVTVEIDGEEVAGLVVLPSGRCTIVVVADDLLVGRRTLDLRAGETTTPDLAWAAAAGAERNERIATDVLPDGGIPWLEWLAAHRSADGTWSADGFVARCRGAPRCDGAVGGVSDVETTASAVFAFLALGETPGTRRYNPYERVVTRALDALVDRQDEEGRLDPAAGPHAMATLALTEVCATTDARRYRDPAQRAVDALLASRDAGRGWGTDGVPDPEATAWACLAIESARAAELDLPDGLETEVLGDLRVFGDPGGAGLSSRAAALLTLARQVLGTPPDDPAVASGVTRVLSEPPGAEGPADALRIWAATAVAFRTGGDAWKRWDRALGDGFLRRVEGPPPVFAHGPGPDLGEAARRLGRVRTVAFAEVCAALHGRFPGVLGVTER